MKTELLVTTLLLSLTIQSGFTQTPPSPERINVAVNEMTNNLSLNEFGIIRLKSLNLKYQQDFEEINQSYSYDFALRNEKLISLNQEYDLNLRAFLRLTSLKAYLAYKENQNSRVAMIQNRSN